MKNLKSEGARHALEEQAIESLVTAGVLANLANILVKALRTKGAVRVSERPAPVVRTGVPRIGI
jgi:hypothetical protein